MGVFSPCVNADRDVQLTCSQVASAAEYRQVLQRHSIELDPERRAAAIWQAVSEAAQRAGGEVPESSRADLLPEVTNLVESPTAVLGTFDEAFLRLPRYADCCLDQTNGLGKCAADEATCVLLWLAAPPA